MARNLAIRCTGTVLMPIAQLVAAKEPAMCLGNRLLKAGLSHSGTAVQTPGTVVSGHSKTDHACDRFPDKTGYSPLGGTKPWVKDRFRTVRRGTSDPKRAVAQVPQSGHSTLQPVEKSDQ